MKNRELIRNAMMFAVKDITGRVLREATVQSMIDDFEKQLTLTDVVGQSEQLVCGCGKKCEKFNKEVEQVKIDLGSSSYW